MAHIQNQVPLLPKISWWRPYWESFAISFPDQVGKQAGVWLLAGVAFLGIWVWGWIVGGGLTRNAGALPSGAVVAFYLKTGCPAGWTKFDEAIGRTIIGADPPGWSGARNLDEGGKPLTGRDFGKPAGTETNVVRPEHLPALTLHSEELKLVNLTDQGPAPSLALVRTSANVGTTSVETKILGGGQSLNNMPPYFPLMYCKNG